MNVSLYEGPWFDFQKSAFLHLGLL